MTNFQDQNLIVFLNHMRDKNFLRDLSKQTKCIACNYESKPLFPKPQKPDFFLLLCVFQSLINKLYCGGECRTDLEEQSDFLQSAC